MNLRSIKFIVKFHWLDYEVPHHKRLSIKYYIVHSHSQQTASDRALTKAAVVPPATTTKLIETDKIMIEDEQSVPQLKSNGIKWENRIGSNKTLHSKKHHIFICYKVTED